MTFEEYKNIIISNMNENDWIFHTCWGYGSGPSYLNKFTVWKNGNGEFAGLEIDSHAERAVLKSDLSISIAWGLSHNDDFREDWANKFPDPNAMSSYIDFFYNGNLVHRDIYVAVDGARAYIPLPKRDINPQTYQVERIYLERDRFEFFKLINLNAHEYSRYVKNAGIEITDEKWF